MLNDDDDDREDDDHEDTGDKEPTPQLHTPEPWSADSTSLFGANGRKRIATAEAIPDRNSYDFRRAAVCVNACKGVSDPVKDGLNTALSDLANVRNDNYVSNNLIGIYERIFDETLHGIGYDAACMLDSVRNPNRPGLRYSNSLDSAQGYEDKMKVFVQTVSELSTMANESKSFKRTILELTGQCSALREEISNLKSDKSQQAEEMKKLRNSLRRGPPSTGTKVLKAKPKSKTDKENKVPAVTARRKTNA